MIAGRIVTWVTEEDTEFDPDLVSPGVAGFVVFAVLGIAVILLGFNLVRRIRRNRYRDEARASIAAELAERDAEDAERGSDAGAATEPDPGAGAAPDADPDPRSRN